MDIGEMPRLIFGIYPGSATGEGPGLLPGPADNPSSIEAALAQLQPDARPFTVRGYIHYIGGGKSANETPVNLVQYAGPGRQLELVVCYRTPDGDLDDWRDFIRATVRQQGSALASLQVTEEPNNPDAASGGDGGFPKVREAVVQGILAAKDEAHRLGFDLHAGFNATPSFGEDPFWPALGGMVDGEFLAALDYVGIDFFPDVFRPLPSRPDGSPISLHDAVVSVLSSFRQTSLPVASIPASIPIHVTENGWPTSNTRPYEKQQAVLQTIVRAINEQRAALNITHYAYFDLRDANSANIEGLQFGLLRDDYNPKPAFDTYRCLITELGAVH